MPETKKVFFPFLPLDYKAAEAWLNEQAQQGWELQRFFGWKRAALQRQPQPRQYAAILGVTSTEGNIRPYHQEQFGKYVAFVESCGWQYVAQRGLLHVFATQPGQTLPPLESDPVAQAEQVRAYALHQLVYAALFLGLSLLLLLLMLGSQGMQPLSLGLNSIVLFLLAGAGGLLVVLLRLGQILLLQCRLKRAEKAMRFLPVRSIRAAELRGVLLVAGIILLAALYIACPLADIYFSVDNFSSIFSVFMPMATALTGLVANPPGRKRRPVLGALVCVGIVLLMMGASLLVWNREAPPVPLAKLQNEPVLTLAQADTELAYNTLNKQHSLLVQRTDYEEGYTRKGGYLRCYAIRCISREMSNSAFEALAYSYMQVYDFSEASQEAPFPGVDRALVQEDASGFTLTLQKGRMAVRIDCRGQRASWREPAFRQQVLMQFFGAEA